MPLAFSPNHPDGEEVGLFLVDAGVTLTTWTAYEFASDYVDVPAAWHFTIGDDDLAKVERDALKLGARVRLVINDEVLCDGHIDTIEVSANRHGGTTWNVSGRDRLAMAVDAVADPSLQFKDGTTLADFLKTIYGPFGWSTDAHFSTSTAANRNVKADIRGTPTTKGGKRTAPRATKEFTVHQLKPHNHEGVHDFARRVAERHGFWIRCSEDGEQIILDVPNYDQEPRYQLRRGLGTTNVLDGTVRYDFSNQPAAIVADSYSRSDVFGQGRLKAWATNQFFGYDAEGQLLPAVADIQRKHPTAKRVPIPYQVFRRRDPTAPQRIVYLHDDESHSQAQLENFVRREIAKLVRHGVTAHYTVEGHGQIVGGRFVPWLVDTVVDVQDEVAELFEQMWIAGVHYSKTRGGSGTQTALTLYRLGAFSLGVQPEEAYQAQQKAAAVTKQRVGHTVRNDDAQKRQRTPIDQLADEVLSQLTAQTLQDRQR